MPFDSPELLSQAGYDSGDFFPSIHTGTGGTGSTSGSSYTNAFTSDIDWRLTWNIVFPSADQTQVVLFALADGSGDQIDVRVQNVTDNETVVEQTGITNSGVDVELGATDYTPTTTGSRTLYRIQIRNSDGTTTVELFDPSIIFGVQL